MGKKKERRRKIKSADVNDALGLITIRNEKKNNRKKGAEKTNKTAIYKAIKTAPAGSVIIYFDASPRPPRHVLSCNV